MCVHGFLNWALGYIPVSGRNCTSRQKLNVPPAWLNWWHAVELCGPFAARQCGNSWNRRLLLCPLLRRVNRTTLTVFSSPTQLRCSSTTLWPRRLSRVSCTVEYRCKSQWLTHHSPGNTCPALNTKCVVSLSWCIQMFWRDTTGQYLHMGRHPLEKHTQWR